jgi:hypothetical protein
MVDGIDIELVRSGSTITGRCGGDVFGFDCKLLFEQGGLRGRLGGEVFGKDVFLGLQSGVNPLLGALLACSVFYYMQIRSRNSNSGNHSSH